MRISIHALLAESDPVSELRVTSKVHFYPRSPCGERRQRIGIRVNKTQFLSTLSLRRATLNLPSRPIDKNISIHALLAESDLIGGVNRAIDINFYPRSPCGERPSTPAVRSQFKHFYPRSPCGERLDGPVSFFNTFGFLSTLSLRRATSLLCFMIQLL